MTSGDGSPELLGRVAARLRNLEGAAEEAVTELRKEAIAAAAPSAPKAGSNRVGRAILHELVLTLSERADALQREAELIAGILERARTAIVDPKRPRTLYAPPVRGEAKESFPQEGKTRVRGKRFQVRPEAARASEPVPRARPTGGSASAGVKLLAAQMALEGESRERIGMRLHSEFGVVDPSAALEEVLEGDPSP